MTTPEPMPAAYYALTATEAEFTTQLLEALALFGWRAVHFRPARTNHGWRTPLQGDKGWPDIFAVRGPRALAAELKSGKGKVEPEQADWLSDLAAAGIETHVWRTTDDFGTIVETIR